MPSATTLPAAFSSRAWKLIVESWVAANVFVGEISSRLITVPPKTNMMFSFGIQDEIKSVMKPQRLTSGYSREALEKINVQK